MKYLLMRELPFMAKGSVFGKGSWVGGGWGVDLGNDKNGAHKGTKVFEKHENELLDSLLENKDWVWQIPESSGELLRLYQEGAIAVDQFCSFAELNYQAIEKWVKGGCDAKNT